MPSNEEKILIIIFPNFAPFPSMWYLTWSLLIIQLELELEICIANFMVAFLGEFNSSTPLSMGMCITA